MECNKDEAIRAKEIAEKKFMAKDIVGAKKFALKAQNLYPGLEGIPQILATLDVYISSENKINGDPDWYGILGVHPQADDETVRKQYRKLALMLHPDKNKSIGADGAFKFISEAWSLLSDKAKRLAYDRKRNLTKVFQKTSTSNGASSGTPRTNGFYNSKASTSNARPPKSTQRAGHSTPSAASHKPKLNTFWTVCHGCKMQYEYLRVYLNHNLLCPNCQEPFLAVETAPPPINSSKSSTSWNFSQQQHSSNHQSTSKHAMNSGRNNGAFNVPDSYCQTNFQWGPFSSAGTASSAAQAASVVHQAYEKVRREREEAQAATKREEALRRKHQGSKRMNGASSTSNAAKRRKGMEDIGVSSHESNVTNQIGVGARARTSNLCASKQRTSEINRVAGVGKPNNAKDISSIEIQKLLMEKAKREIHRKLQESKSANGTKTTVEAERNVNVKGEKSLVDNGAYDHTKSDKFVRGKNEACCITSARGTCHVHKNMETLETLSINVPDSDFYDFDKDRTERSFEHNQVWAAYDDDDGMPRYYAVIHEVISLNPFRMRISWLNSKTNSEFAPLNWVASGFSKTCGDFRVGRYEIYSSLNSFSHKVRFTKGTHGVICIYPKKGDTWALYRNWSPDWNELTADEVIHKYDIVEVLEDYNEEVGVLVTPLVKVAGFKTVFHRHLDPREARRIPKDEMFRFSHQVPSYLLTGQEASNAPKGCRELDPAATPVELLQVIVDSAEEEFVGEEKANEEIVMDDVEVSDDKEVENNDKTRQVEKENSKIID